MMTPSEHNNITSDLVIPLVVSKMIRLVETKVSGFFMFYGRTLLLLLLLLLTLFDDQ